MRNRTSIRNKVSLPVIILVFVISLIALVDNVIKGDKIYELKDDKATEFALQIQKAGELLPPDNKEYVKTYQLSRDEDDSLVLTITDIDNNISICKLDPTTYAVLDLHADGSNPKALRTLINICCILSGGMLISMLISFIKEKTARI